MTNPLQPHPLTSAMQMGITFCSLCVAAAAILFAIRSFSEERNARLVEIGVNVLRVDPTKETQVSAAREWALDLIDANAGGIRFSDKARSELMNRPLDLSPWAFGESDSTQRVRPNLRPNFQ
ncbi:hypothetical protein [Tardiphaga robiniae]|uniref:Uncharacterized protein n=1 Tax=Tardiphaga robiniae TaxID=943830 RepID=A0A7G6TVI8_9BRAD|nr:hypothetical protein [Tardiphaga robiniae]QND70770.1 hypothetical protein HB776_05625 [Tardiphaga robiniae]